MKNSHKYLLIKLLYISIDVVCIYFVLFMSCLLRQKLVSFPISFPEFFLDPQNPFRFILFFWTAATVIVLNANSLYQTKHETLRGVEIWLVIKSVTLSSLMAVLAIYALKIDVFPRTVFMNSTLGMVIMLSIWRAIKRWFVDYLVSQGYNNFNAVIIGAGKVGTALAQEIANRPNLGIKVIGFLDDFVKQSPPVRNARILGKISDFSEVARKEFVNKVFITIHHDSDIFLNILEQAKEMGIAVRVVPQGYDLATGEFEKYNIGFIPILEYVDVKSLRKQTGKRLFDFIISFLTLLIVWPLFVIIGILIKLDSSGPVFFVSKRFGKSGKIFQMLKFRSMIQGAEKKLDELRAKNEIDGPIFKIRKDPRVTKVGSFLRKYSLDELPQLINVMVGDMSLVGPRPLPIDQIEKEDLKQLKRLEVRPGITGLWQIRGRSDLAFGRLVKWDIWYINNWSFWLDITILFQTIPVVVKGKGAY